MLSQTVLALVHRSVSAMESSRDAASGSLESVAGRDPSIADAAHGLVAVMGERCQATTLLVQAGKLWDCEILLRSACEAVLKLAFLCLAEEEERSSRIEELRDALPSIADLRQSQRAQHRLSSQVPGCAEYSVFQAVVLSPTEEATIREQWPRKQRRELIAKWSVPRIVEWLNKRATSGRAPNGIRAILHTYGIGSHVAHSDWRSIELVRERRSRESSERERLEDAHAARLLSDMVSYYRMATHLIGLLAQDVRSPAHDRADQRIDAFQRNAEKVLARFYEGQGELYRGLGLPYSKPAGGDED